MQSQAFDCFSLKMLNMGNNAMINFLLGDIVLGGSYNDFSRTCVETKTRELLS